MSALRLALAMQGVRRMVETIVTIPRGDEVITGSVGAATGLVIAKLGLAGVACTLPMLLLFGTVVTAELCTRRLSTAVMAFGAAAVAVAWLVR